MATIGIIGLGKMGRPMARHLMRAGHKVTGCDPVDAARAAAAALGVEIRPNPRAMAADAELVFIVVGFDSEVETVIFAADGLMAGARPGLTIAVGSTISPSYARKIARRLEGRDVVLLDVPSTRGEQALEAGEILILGGGNKAAFDRWTPAMRTFANDIFHFGAFGTGQVAKMVNNLILWACMAASDEGLRLAEALGVDPEALRAALHKSSAQNWSMSTRAEDRPIPWAEKDLLIALREADGVRMSLPVSGTVREAMKAYKIRRGIPTPAEIE